MIRGTNLTDFLKIQYNLIAVNKKSRPEVKIASSLMTSIISFTIIEELLAMTEVLINREMGMDGGFAAIHSHLSSLRVSPVIARSISEQNVPNELSDSNATKQSYD